MSPSNREVIARDNLNEDGDTRESQKSKCESPLWAINRWVTLPVSQCECKFGDRPLSVTKSNTFSESVDQQVSRDVHDCTSQFNYPHTINESLVRPDN